MVAVSSIFEIHTDGEKYSVVGTTQTLSATGILGRDNSIELCLASRVVRHLLPSDEGPRTPRRSLSMASLNMSRTSSEVDFVGKGTDLNVAGLEEALKEVAGAGTTGESAAAVGALGTSSRKQRRAAISVAVGMAIVAAFASVALLKRKRV